MIIKFFILAIIATGPDTVEVRRQEVSDLKQCVRIAPSLEMAARQQNVQLKAYCIAEAASV